MEENKKENALYKKWWFWLIVVLLVIIIVLIVILLTNNKTTGVGSAGINKTEFEKIKTGMTEFEVNDIIDEQDEWKKDGIYDKCVEQISKSSKNGIYTYENKYYGEKSGYVIITYEVDYSEGVYGLKYPEVIKKQQFNLK